jgi:hypothetical protein
VAAVLMLAGCTDGAPAPTATVRSPGPNSTSAPTTGKHPKGTTRTPVPGANCLKGRWRLVRFTSHGGLVNYGSGRGGDVTMTFGNGGYTLLGHGKKPIRVKRAGESADLWIDGTVKGSHAPDGKSMAFTIDHATGKATVVSGGQRQTLPVSSIAEMLAPTGKASLACPHNVLTITLPTVRLDLRR